MNVQRMLSQLFQNPVKPGLVRRRERVAHRFGVDNLERRALQTALNPGAPALVAVSSPAPAINVTYEPVQVGVVPNDIKDQIDVEND
jgi:hypothetical protein